MAQNCSVCKVPLIGGSFFMDAPRCEIHPTHREGCDSNFHDPGIREQFTEVETCTVCGKT